MPDWLSTSKKDYDLVRAFYLSGFASKAMNNQFGYHLPSELVNDFKDNEFAAQEKWNTIPIVYGEIKSIRMVNNKPIVELILERIKSNDLLQRPVDAACSFEKELDVTSIVTFKDDAGMRDVAYVSISGYEPDAIRAQCELLKAMFMLRTKYPWDTGRVCFPMEELTATIDSQLYHDNPEKFFSLLAGNGLNCVSGLG
ncbi:hypothetical protein ABN773_26325 (plasmid) [Escherichia coli]